MLSKRMDNVYKNRKVKEDYFMMESIISKMRRRKRNGDLRYIDSYEKNFVIDFFFLVGTLDKIDFILRYRMRRNGKGECNRHPTGA
jgi:hypothetical protein